MDLQLLLLVSLTTATIKTARSLVCYKCNATWSATMCLRNARIESCSHGSESVCMSIDASLTDLKGDKSILFVRQCASKSECYSSQPCRDVKLHLWRKRPGLLVEPSCRPQCCASDLCNHPVATPHLIKSSTYKSVPTSAVRTTPKKCFEFEPEFVSKLNRRKPREKRCSKNGAFDSCFTLQAQVLDATTQRVTEIAEWKDCATESRDCHAIANRCTMLRELAKNRGAHVKNCTVSCCREDLCNARTSFPANIQLEIEGNSASQLKGICGISVLSSVIVFLNSLL